MTSASLPPPRPEIAGISVSASATTHGVEAVNVQGPSFDYLAPLGTVRPVYPMLSDALADRQALALGNNQDIDLGERQPSLTDDQKHARQRLAHVLATCAGYAYSDAPTVSMMMTRLGLEENRCRMISQTVDAMFIRSSAFLVQSYDGRVVILCYRGTEPTSLINWLTDADIDPERSHPEVSPNPKAQMHAGFYRNVRATRFDILAALGRAIDRKSVLGENDTWRPENPLEAFYITGHSLGGAMAALMTYMLHRDATSSKLAKSIVDKLCATYTFGQPMVGTSAFAEACSHVPFLAKRVFRYIYKNDVVPALPPAASGKYKHFGQEYQLVHDNWQPMTRAIRQVPSLFYLALAPVAFFARQIALSRNIAFPFSMHAHSPQHYISALTPDGVTSEFSTAPYVAPAPAPSQ